MWMSTKKLPWNSKISWWVLRVQWTLGTRFCVLWHATHVYVVVVVWNPLTLVSGLSAPISVHSGPLTTENLPKIESLLFLNYHKLFICLLLISTWYSSSFLTFYSQALYLLASNNPPNILYHSWHSIHKLYFCLLVIIHLIILDILLTSFISACF